mgnify:CR=1 FL=1
MRRITLKAGDAVTAQKTVVARIAPSDPTFLDARSEREARAAVRRVADALYDPAGGVIAQFEFGAGARLENAHAVHEEWGRIAGG